MTSNKNQLEVSDTTFEIVRSEGWGYVQNYCNYDKNILELEILYEASPLEGGNCKATYKFITKKKTDTIIEFVEDYSDYKYEYRYRYDSKNNTVKYIGCSKY